MYISHTRHTSSCYSSKSLDQQYLSMSNKSYIRQLVRYNHKEISAASAYNEILSRWLWFWNKVSGKINLIRHLLISVIAKCEMQFNGNTPWKSNRNLFLTQIFYHLFLVVCSSFYTWYMWGDPYQFCNFLLDFDHWLYLSGILKQVTGSKPDVALVWFMQWANIELEHGEKDWCIVRV